jgi:hypothetical protein
VSIVENVIGSETIRAHPGPIRTGRTMPTDRSLLWTVHHDGRLYECLMVMLRNGRFEVRIVSAGAEVVSQSFGNRDAALAWSEEQRHRLATS